MMTKLHFIVKTMAGTAMIIAVAAGAQTPAASAPAQTPAPAAAPAAARGSAHVERWPDGHQRLHRRLLQLQLQPPERPTGVRPDDQINELYNFNDKTDQFNLSAAKLTLNHDPDPVGAHVDFFYGRTNTLINSAATNAVRRSGQLHRAGVSEPEAAQGQGLRAGLRQVRHLGRRGSDRGEGQLELLPFAAVCECHSLLHFGVRTSMPVSKTDTIGVQVVNGWNNVTKNNGGVTVGLTNALCQAEVHLEPELLSSARKTPTRRRASAT